MTAKRQGKSEKPVKEIKTKALNGETAKSQLPIGQAPKEIFSLHVKGSKWIKDRDNSESRLKALNSRIIRVRHPRQKSADYAYIDFASAEDRDEAYKELLPLKDVYVEAARKDNAQLVALRKAKVEAKREAKQQLAALMKSIAKNEQREKQSEKPKKLSNQIVILNLPKVTTRIELNEHFENVVDAKLGLNKNPKQTISKAILTLATPREAFNASKKVIKLNGIQLKIQLHQNLNDVRKSKRVEKAKKRKLTESEKKGTENASEEPTAKLPLVLAPEKRNAKKKGTEAAKAAKEVNQVKKSLVKTVKPKKASPAKKVVKTKE